MPWMRIEHADDLLADAAQLVQVIAVDLDDQRAVRAADQVIDAVDDGLADADGIAGQILARGRAASLSTNCFLVSPCGQVS